MVQKGSPLTAWIELEVRSADETEAGERCERKERESRPCSCRLLPPRRHPPIFFNRASISPASSDGPIDFPATTVQQKRCTLIQYQLDLRERFFLHRRVSSSPRLQLLCSPRSPIKKVARAQLSTSLPPTSNRSLPVARSGWISPTLRRCYQSTAFQPSSSTSLVFWRQLMARALAATDERLGPAMRVVLLLFRLNGFIRLQGGYLQHANQADPW